MLHVHCKSLLILHLLVICLSAVDCENSTRALVISNETVTWLEGQRQCAEKNGRLLSSDDFSLYLQEVLEKVSGDFWLGDMQKVSEWIHILGCYRKASIENDLSSPTNLPSLKHQDAVKNTVSMKNCHYTLPLRKKHVTASNLTSASVTSCDYNCNSEEPKACGSNTGQYLSVYKTTNTSDKGTNAMCMSIQCGAADELYMPEDCMVPLFPYCSNNNIGIGGSWAAANAMCLSGNGYLVGEANLDDPTSKCNEIKNKLPNTFIFWIGIRRQVYKSTDKGYPIELNSLKSCEFFSGRNSITMQSNNCNEKHHVVCLVPNNVIKTDPPTAEKKREHDDGISTTSTVIVSIISTLFAIIIICVAVIIVFYKRRRRKAHSGKEQIDNIPQNATEDLQFYDQLGDLNDDHTYHKISSSRNDSCYQELHVYKNTEFAKTKNS